MLESNVIKKRNSSLENALCFLNLFSYERTDIKANGVASELNIANSTVHRLAETLIEEGFIFKDPISNSYRLGTSILSLTQIVKANSNLYNASKPFVDALAKTCNENVTLGIMKELDIIFLYSIEYSQSFSLKTHISNRTSLHCTAIGQLLLAYQPLAMIKKLETISLPQYTTKTLIDYTKLIQRFDQIRAQGFAVSSDEQFDGITSISCPVLNNKGKIVAAISITGRTPKIHSSVQQFVNDINACSQRISKSLVMY